MTCTYPDGGAQEYAVGLRRALGGVLWQGHMGIGGGLLSWQQKRDPFIDLIGEVRRPLFWRTSMLLGINVVVAPGVERPRHGYDTIVRKKNVVFPNGILGLAVRIF